MNAQGIALKKLRLLRGVIQMQREGFFAGLQAEHVQQLLAQLAQREIAHLQLQRTFFEFGRIQNVVEQAQQGAPRLPHGGQLALLLWVQGGIEQGLGKPQNGVQRCADFMAHIGQKAAARLAGLLGLLFGLAQQQAHFRRIATKEHHVGLDGFELGNHGGVIAVPGINTVVQGNICPQFLQRSLHMLGHAGTIGLFVVQHDDGLGVQAGGDKAGGKGALLVIAANGAEKVAALEVVRHLRRRRTGGDGNNALFFVNFCCRHRDPRADVGDRKFGT